MDTRAGAVIGVLRPRLTCLATAITLLVSVAVLTLCGPKALGRFRALGMSTAATSHDTSTAVASPSGAIVVYVTVPNQEIGEALAGKLVEQKLAACVNILHGITSIYYWEGKVNKDSELLLIIKTRSELLPALTAYVKDKENHPYDEPEVIALPILGGSPSYIKWLFNSTKSS